MRRPWGAGLKKSSSMDGQGNWVKYKSVDGTDHVNDSHIPIQDQATDPTSGIEFPDDPEVFPDDPFVIEP